MSAQKFVVWFNEVDKEDIPLVGGKGANLGEMTKAQFPVPPGFIVTANAYFHFLDKSKLNQKIERYLKDVNYNDPNDIDRVSHVLKKEIISAPMPKEIAELIIKYYFQLSDFVDAQNRPHRNLWRKIHHKANSHETRVAIRSSATAEDLPTASFAGQQETFLNIRGEANVVEYVKEAWASLFTPRAIFYRHQNNFDHLKVGIAVPVQKMVNSQSSGVMFTLDPVNNNKGIVVVEAIFGLGEFIVQGIVTPDHYEVEKSSLKILKKEVATQTVYLPGLGKVKASLPHQLRTKQKITDNLIIELAKIGKRLEHHYYFPQDIEWGIEDGHLYILQTRPITTINQNKKTEAQKVNLTQKVILQGSPASPGIGVGTVAIVRDLSHLDTVKEGNVLVASQTNPDFVPAMKKATAIVTEKGGRTSHAAIVSRELGIPAVVGTPNALSVLKNGDLITVEGSSGKVYEGKPEDSILSQIKSEQLATLDSKLKTATKVYVNLADPGRVKEVASLNVDGVGLLRAEFMLAQIGIHPKKIVADGKNHWFIGELSKKIAAFCEAFGPKRPIIYRATDFKTNEYQNLKYGYLYEKPEENPMLGFRGASRYIADNSVFEMELSAIKEVRNKLNHKNLNVMIPFVRTVDELLEVKKIMASCGLQRTPSFKLWMMVEIPSNVILIEEFLKCGIDGVSIGSNDLTQLILGVDRDNSTVSGSFSEKNPAVLWALERVVKMCHKYKTTCSICGQAPSDYPDLVEKLVGWGITSVSVNIDAISKVRETIYGIENKHLIKK